MSEFFSERTIKATRKPHHCFACNGVIPIGMSARYYAMKDDGIFFDAHYHIECRAAEIAWNDKNDTWGDEFTGLCLIKESDDADSELAWLAEHHPITASRLAP